MEEDVKKRFYNHLSQRPRGADDKSGPWLFMGKEQAINYKFVQLPNQKRKYICLDLDYGLAGSAWMNINMLQPTIIIINPQNGHAKYLFELAKPVLFPLADGRRAPWISQKAINYYHGITRGLNEVLSGDKGYTGHNINNPLHHYWITHFYDVTYSLDEISEYVPYVPKQYTPIDDELCEGRAVLMFNHCRKAMYPKVKDYSNLDDWKNAVEQYVLDYYYNVAKHIPSDHELTLTEALGVSKSISKWIWSKKDDPNFKQYMYNRGVMELPPIKANLADDILKKERTKRQALGAKYVNERRMQVTIKKIENAALQLKASGQKVTKSSICQLTGLNSSYLHRFKDLIKSLK